MFSMEWFINITDRDEQRERPETVSRRVPSQTPTNRTDGRPLFRPLLPTAPKHQRVPHRTPQTQTDTRYSHPNLGFKTGVFSKEEISNIFTLFDLKREGHIDKERCKEALKTLANNEFQWEQVEAAGIPDKVDEKGFVALCEKVLGAK